MPDNPYTSPRETSEIQRGRRRFGLGNVVFLGLGAIMLLPMLVVVRSMPLVGAIFIITPLAALGVAILFHGVKRSNATLAAIGLVFAVILLLIVAAVVMGFDI